MSTEFRTNVEFGVFEAIFWNSLREPNMQIYRGKCWLVGSGGYGLYLWCSEQGEAILERFGSTDPGPTLKMVEDTLGIRVEDEYGLLYPEESGG